MGDISKERYKELDEWGVCHCCQKKFKAPGKQYCPDCLDKSKKARARYRKEHPPTDEQKAANLERQRKLYEERKKNGLCVKCGKLATNGRLCHECYIKEKNRRSYKGRQHAEC